MKTCKSTTDFWLCFYDMCCVQKRLQITIVLFTSHSPHSANFITVNIVVLYILGGNLVKDFLEQEIFAC